MSKSLISVYAVVCLALAFAFIYVLVLCCRCYNARRNRDDLSDVRVTLASSMSSEALAFAPPLPPYQMSLGNVDDLSDLDYSVMVDQPMILTQTHKEIKKSASSGDQASSENENIGCCNVEKVSGFNILPRLQCKQPSIEKLWSSLDKSTLSLQWPSESAQQEKNNPEKLSATGLLAPNTTPEGGKFGKHDSGVFGRKLNTALFKLQEDNDTEIASVNDFGSFKEKTLLPKRYDELIPNLALSDSHLSSNNNASTLSVYKSATSLPLSSTYDDTFSFFDSLSSNSS